MSNPKKAFKPRRFGKSISAVSGDILGFINRDAQITERQAVPQCVFPMGRDFMAMANQHNLGLPGWQNGASFFGDCVTNCKPNECVPGFATIWLAPMCSGSDMDGVNVTKPVYRAKWQASRNLDNMTKNWQPGDMQAVDLGLSTVVAMIHTARRAIAIMRDVTQHSDNIYYNPVAMLKAMGFDFTLGEISANYDSLWSSYNKLLVDTIGANQWLSFSFPGARRWARLFDNIYRDNPADSRYAQYYIFMPAWMPTFNEVVLPDGTVSYQLDGMRYQSDDPSKPWYNASKGGELIPFRRIFDYQRTIELSRRGTQQFMFFLTLIGNYLEKLFYSDSTADIIATLNAMEKRNLSSQLTASGDINVERVDFQDLSSDHRAPEVYDETILVAIANATIAPYLNTSPAIINAKTGDMHQSLYVTNSAMNPENVAAEDATYPNYKNYENWALRSFMHPKVVNFVNCVPTQSDYISMTQWTLSTSNTFWMDSSPTQEAPNPYLRTIVAGSDYIAGIDFTTRSTDENKYQNPFSCEAWDIIPYSQNITMPVNSAAMRYYEENHGGVDLTGEAFIQEQIFELAQQFAFIPTPNLYSYGLYEGAYKFRWDGPIVQSEVYFIADGEVLRSLHGQWIANFFGYPVFGQNFGTPTFTTSHSDSFSAFISSTNSMTATEADTSSTGSSVSDSGQTE